MGGIIFGGKNPVVPFLLRDKEVGGIKVNIGFIQIIINLNKVKKEIKTLWEIIFFFTWSL